MNTSSILPVCYQVNLQRGFGGGEVYTIFFTKALDALGVKTVLFTHPEATHWHQRLPSSAEVIPVTPDALANRLGQLETPWTLFHTLAPAAVVDAVHNAKGIATCIAHMPWYDRNPAALMPYDLILPVSQHVADSLRVRGLEKIYAEPLYGVAELSGRQGNPNSPLLKGNVYDWDKRKVRDRLLSVVYPWIQPLLPRPAFTKKPGITLGIVSRLTTIKQFPALFNHIAPVLARFPHVHVEIFGSGGYASVRDLKRVLAPIRDRVRFWGHQQNVGAVYAHIDYLLAGLPEKEALGLNILEAQACGVPVLAVAAPPFTETIIDNLTGLLYPDPRQDKGAGFAALLSRLSDTPFKIDHAKAAEHLRTFSEDAFILRIKHLIDLLNSGSGNLWKIGTGNHSKV